MSPIRRDLDARFRTLFESSPQPTLVYDLETLRFLEVNEAAVRQYGYGREELLGMTARDVRPGVEDLVPLDEALSSELPKWWSPGVWRHRTKEGRLITVAVSASEAEIGERRVRIVVASKVTGEVEAPTVLRPGDDGLRSVLESMGEGLLLADLEGVLTFANRRFLELTGYRRGEVVGRSVTEVFETLDRAKTRESLERCLRGATEVYETELLAADGRFLVVEVHASPLRDSVGRIVGLISAVDDLTERRRTERRLREIVENASNVFYSHTPEGELTYLSPQFEGFAGYPPEEAKRRWTELITDHPVNERRAELTRRAVETGEPQEPSELELRHADGHRIWAEVREAPVVEGGETTSIVGSLTDVTEKKRAEEILSRTEERLSRILAQAPAVMYTASADGRFRATYVSENAEAILGHSAGCFVEDESFWRGHVHPDDLPAVQERLRGLLARGKGTLEYRFRLPDGEYRWLQDEQTVMRDASGRPGEVIGFVLDVTERKQLEEQLRQSQKMEAVGRLAGGIAHDFNNVLTAITGYCELLLARFSDDREVLQDLEEIERAGQRAASLIRQLLAFSRNQVLQPKVLDLNNAVRDMEKMLLRVIGEDVVLRTELASEPGMVRMDPSQLEQVIMNLVVNSRDAMPGGGELILETVSVELSEELETRHVIVPTGRYVTLVVSDTGEGMDKETQERIFEPFFTTKESSKGTGLGLATVYGIVKQSRGFIFVYSEPGHGSMFKIYLPRAEGGSPEADREQATGEGVGGSETVVVAEDDSSVRALVVRALSGKGYRVVEASSGKRALEACRELGDAVDLVLTDFVMPDMRGTDLERAVREELPDVPFLFMSGYAQLFDEGRDDPDRELLQKPFTPTEVVSRVRRALDDAG